MTINDDNLIEFFRWCHAEGKLPGLIIMLFLMSLCLIGIVSIIYGSANKTNSTANMIFSDRWDCGYINTTTTLSEICAGKVGEGND